METRLRDMLIDIAWNDRADKSELFFLKEFADAFALSVQRLEKKILSQKNGELAESAIRFYHLFCGHEGSIVGVLLETDENAALHESYILLRNFFNGNEEKSLDTLNLETISPYDSLEKVIESMRSPEIPESVIARILKSPSAEDISVLVDGMAISCRQVFSHDDFAKTPVHILCTIINLIRVFEYGDRKIKAQYMRSKLLNALLEQKLDESIYSAGTRPVFLDKNGLFIQIKGLSSHLPYGLISDEAILGLQKLNIVTESEMEELRVRTFFERSAYNEYIAQKNSQYQKFIMDGDGVALQDYFTDNPLPDQYLHEKFSEAQYDSIGEVISIVNAAIFEENQSIESDLKKIHTPNYYVVTKMIQALIDAGIQNDYDAGFAIIRTDYQKTKTGSHIALIAIFYGSSYVRFPIDIRKHLNDRQRSLLELAIPLFSRDEYMRLERAARNFLIYAECVKSIQTPNGKLGENQAIKYILDFLLNNVSDFFSNADEAAKTNNMKLFSQIAEQGKIQYIRFLFSYLGKPSQFDSEFNPNVKKSDVIFSRDFLMQAQAILKPGHFAESLFKDDQKIRVVQILRGTHSISQTIPSHVEESVLDALRMHKGRPLINLIGGSSRIANAAQNPMKLIGKVVVGIAHELNLNVSVPGTQSGLGEYLAFENIEYQKRYSDLSHHKKMHMFSVSPGGNSFFPGNISFLPDNRSDNFALSPVDSIITPYPADWNIDDHRIRSSNYILHIAYMESLCARISEGNRHIVLISNGGLFTLAELDQLLRQPIAIIFVKETGRFASAMSALLDSLPEIPTNDYMAFIKYIRASLAESLPADIYGEFIEKDFGLTDDVSENSRQAFYRELFLSIVTKIQQNNYQIASVAIDGLSETLQQILG